MRNLLDQELEEDEMFAEEVDDRDFEAQGICLSSLGVFHRRKRISYSIVSVP
jgi:hypothetical protein